MTIFQALIRRTFSRCGLTTAVRAVDPKDPSCAKSPVTAVTSTAEGFPRHLAGNRFVPFSARTESTNVSPLSMEVMSEAGVDISTQRSREFASLFRETFHYIVVLCDPPRERYPLYPFARHLLKWSVANPEVENEGTESKKHAFR